MRRWRSLLDASLAALGRAKPGLYELQGRVHWLGKDGVGNVARDVVKQSWIWAEGRHGASLCTAALRCEREELSLAPEAGPAVRHVEDAPNGSWEAGEGQAFQSDAVVAQGSGRTGARVLPKVMIVGRPNVGKSALFNRLTRKREALVYDTPDAHVTRDVREGMARLGDMRFIVADTAGLETEAETNNLLARTAGLTAAALSNCQIALFLVDGRAGLQPGDADIGKWLRRHAPHLRVLVLLNKAEGIHNDASGGILATLAEAHGLGFGDPLAVSAETGEGMSELFTALQPWIEEFMLETLDEGAVDDVDGDIDSTETVKKVPLQLAIAGRPNVGKSTLLNALLQQERVLTGCEPGLTRDAVRVKFEYEGETVYLVDTAGWMQRSRLEEGPAALSAMHARESIMRAHIVALVLDAEEIANARKTLLHAEAALAQWVVEEGRGLVVVVNKMDLLQGPENAKLRKKVLQAVPKELKLLLPQIDNLPVCFASARDGQGRAEIMSNVFGCYKRWCCRLSTAQLNKWLQKVISRHPKVGGGHGPKVRYMTQVKSRPPTFVVFVSGLGKLQATDLRFLVSALQEDFNLGGIPVRVLQRNNSRGRTV